MIAASTAPIVLAGESSRTALARPNKSQSDGSITVRVTAADRRYALADPLHWRPTSGRTGANRIVIQPARKRQPILGFGAALTDAACYMINRMPEAEREKLLLDLFDPKQMAFNVCRLAIGSSDYATSMYSFDEGAHDLPNR